MKKQSGFTAIEGLLILVIMGVVGFTGWYVWQSRNKANSTYNAANTTANSQVTYSKKSISSSTTTSGSNGVIPLTPETEAGQAFYNCANRQDAQSDPSITTSPYIAQTYPYGICRLNGVNYQQQGNLPTANDVKSAQAVMVANCNYGCTADSSANSIKVAPGYVLDGLSFHSGNGGAAYVTKLINGKWTVIWSGQSCMPIATVKQYNVPNYMGGPGC